MKTLFSTIFGSRLYGTDVPDSDFDYKHIVLPDIDGLFLGKEPVNVFSNNVERVPLHVLAKDFLRGKTYAIELAFTVGDSALDHRVRDPRILSFCSELRSRFLTKNVVNMVKFAQSQATKYAVKGERLNAVRKLCDLLSGFPMHARLLDHGCDIDYMVHDLHEQYPECISNDWYDSDGQGKMRSCIKLNGRTFPLTATIEHTCKQLEALKKDYGKRTQKSADNDGSDRKALMHAVRIADEGREVLTTHRLVLPHNPRYVETELAPIRDGRLPKERVIEILNERIVDLYEAKLHSSLPEYSETLFLELEAWLVTWLKRFYFDA